MNGSRRAEPVLPMPATIAEIAQEPAQPLAQPPGQAVDEQLRELFERAMQERIPAAPTPMPEPAAPAAPPPASTATRDGERVMPAAEHAVDAPQPQPVSNEHAPRPLGRGRREKPKQRSAPQCLPPDVPACPTVSNLIVPPMVPAPRPDALPTAPKAQARCYAPVPAIQPPVAIVHVDETRVAELPAVPIGETKPDARAGDRPMEPAAPPSLPSPGRAATEPPAPGENLGDTAPPVVPQPPPPAQATEGAGEPQVHARPAPVEHRSPQPVAQPDELVAPASPPPDRDDGRHHDDHRQREPSTPTVEQMAPAQPVAPVVQASEPVVEKTHDSVTRKHLVDTVERLMVGEMRGGQQQVRIEIRADVLPGTSVTVQQAAAQVQVAFVCSVQESRQQLDRMASGFARSLARRLGRDVVVRVAADDDELPPLEIMAHPGEAA